MQNTIDKSYINKVINIKSELLFREAEDDFYYFYKLNSAAKKLKTAISFTPFHFKSLVMLADICFIKGNINKAIKLYKKAENICPDNTKILASLANCYNTNNSSNSAILYADKAIKSFKNINYALYTQIIEIKVNNLFKLKKYKEAYSVLYEIKKSGEFNVTNSLYLSSISKKLKLQKKIDYSGLKII